MILFLDVIPDTLRNENLQQRATEVFIRSRNRDICLVLWQNLILLHQKVLD